MRFVLLDQKQNIYSYLTECLSATETQEINTAMQLYAEFKLDKNTLKKLDKCFYIGVPARYDTDNKFHLYRVTSSKIAETIIVEGVEEAFDDLKGRKIVKDRRFYNQDIQKPLEAIFEGTNWTLDNRSTSVGSTNFYYDSQLDCFSKLKDAYSFEIRFLYEFKGSQITKRIAGVRNRIGKDTTKRFVYGRDTASIGKEQNTSDYYTAIVGRGNGEQTDDGGYGRKITFEDVSWSKSKGDPLDKPLGQAFLEFPEATKVWGYADGTPRIKAVDFDTDDKNELLNLSYQSLMENCVPKNNLSATINYDGSIMLGDTVTIVRHEPKIVFRSRIIKITRNLLAPELTSVEIGEKTFSTQAEREQQTSKDIQKTSTKVDKTSQEVKDTKTDLLVKINEEKLDIEAKQKELNDKIGKYKQDVQDYLDGVGGDLVYGKQALETKNPDGSRLKLSGLGLSYYGTSGEIKTAIDNRGKVYADEIVAGSLISAPTISGGYVQGVQITGGQVDGASFLRSVSPYGLSQNAVVSYNNGFSVSGGGGLAISGGGSINLNGIWIQNVGGQLYVDGHKVLTE